jgi:hypothetical protein
MERLLKLLIMLLFALIVCAPLFQGCTAPRYTYTSEEGRRCFYQCDSQYWTCTSWCGNNFGCVGSCKNARRSCMRSCPDLIEETR